MDKLHIFIQRMLKLGIDIQLAGNYPRIYIDTINGVKVTELFHANHGFPIGGEREYKFTDIGKIFKLIRKYI